MFIFSFVPDFQNVLILVVAAIHLLLIGLLLMSDRAPGKARTLFILLEVSLIIWALTMVFFRSAETTAISLFWAKILYIVPITIPLIFMYFIYSFPQDESKRFGFFDHVGINAVPFIVFLITITDGLLIQDVIIPAEGEKKIIFAALPYAYYSIYLIGYFTWSYIHLFFEYKNARGLIKQQIKFLLGGTLLSTIVATQTNLIFLWFGVFTYNWVGQIAIVIMAVSITIALSRYNLFNTKVISAELFSGSLIIVLLTQFLLAENFNQYLISSLVLAATIGLTFLLIRSILKEVTDREKIELLASQLQGANKELERVSQAKSDFLSIASHQLKTPLSIIKGYVSMSMEGAFGKMSKELRLQMNKVYISNERLISLVEDLLNLSRIEDGRMKYDWDTADIGEIAYSVAEEMRDTAKKKNLAFVFKKPTEVFRARVDINKIRNVVFNLIDNAIKYTNEGSITISLGRNNNHIILSVSDTGRGMKKENLAKIFQKFTRAEHAPGSRNARVYGFGLGLYVARLITEAHHGTIRAESQGMGAGSTFILELPIISSEPAPKSAAADHV